MTVRCAVTAVIGLLHVNDSTEASALTCARLPSSARAKLSCARELICSDYFLARAFVMTYQSSRYSYRRSVWGHHPASASDPRPPDESGV